MRAAGDATHFGNFIRECRKGLRYTSREVARLSHGSDSLPSISNSYLISVENGKHIPRLDKVIALAEVLNVPVMQLIERCREDLRDNVEATPVGPFVELFAAARERAAANDHTRALELFRQAQQAATALNGDFPREQDAELRLQMANCYRRLKINRVAKEEIENLLRHAWLEPQLKARGAFVLAEIYREEKSNFLGHAIALEALQLARTANDAALEGKILCTLAGFAAEEGRTDEALSLYRDAATRLKGAGEDRAARLARIRQGLILLEKREWFRAIDMLRSELSDASDPDIYARAWLHVGLAKAYYGAENYKATRSHARSARECAEKLDTPDVVFLAIYYQWQAARRERAEELAASCLERLTYYRNKLDVAFPEIETFDRFRKTANPSLQKGVTR